MTSVLAKKLRDPSPERFSLADRGKADSDLEQRVQGLLGAGTPDGWTATGARREVYLDLMERIVRGAAGWVDASGAVVDPVVGRECGQTTSRFVSSGAILLSFGRAPELADTVFRAMSSCCRRLGTDGSTRDSPDFWMRELATATMALEGIAAEPLRQRWAADLGAVQPERVYRVVRPDGTNLEKLNNWVVYASAGEYLRQAAGIAACADGISGQAFFDKYMPAQLANFTEHGMYRDPGDPITYDITTRLQLATALAFGYDGALREPLGELLRRGALATLLFVSPEGYVPYGGRSSQFHFQEAIVCALCELEARRYRGVDARLAGAFRRQAHRSAHAIRRWVVGMQPWRHIKNGFDPATHHGIDSYGQYSVYSLTLSSFLGLAAVFADDTIEEAPCPAELGGYALTLQPAFHKVFACCRDACVEIDTAASAHYDATGLGRFHVSGTPLELVLGMPCARRIEHAGTPYIAVAPGRRQPDRPVAIGPVWRTGEQWTSLAELADGLIASTHVTLASPQAVAFHVLYELKNRGLRVVEHYVLQPRELSIRCDVSVAEQPPSSCALVIPLLVTDGASGAMTRLADDAAVVFYRGCTYRVIFDPEQVIATLADEEYVNRHGAYRSLTLTGRQPGSISATLCVDG